MEHIVQPQYLGEAILDLSITKLEIGLKRRINFGASKQTKYCFNITTWYYVQSKKGFCDISNF